MAEVEEVEHILIFYLLVLFVTKKNQKVSLRAVSRISLLPKCFTAKMTPSAYPSAFLRTLRTLEAETVQLQCHEKRRCQLHLFEGEECAGHFSYSTRMPSPGGILVERAHRYILLCIASPESVTDKDFWLLCISAK